MAAFIAFIGRCLFGVFFFYTGLQGVMNWNARLALIPDWLPVHSVLLGGAMALLLVGSVLVALGLGARFGAVLLLIFLGVITPIMHPMWSDPSQTLAFMRNMTFFGGALLVLAYGAGPASFDHAVRRRRARRVTVEEE